MQVLRRDEIKSIVGGDRCACYFGSQCAGREKDGINISNKTGIIDALNMCREHCCTGEPYIFYGYWGNCYGCDNEIQHLGVPPLYPINPDVS